MPPPSIPAKSKSNPKSKPNLQSQPPIPASFTTKKQTILSALAVPDNEYTDNSPKGSVDAPIIELIEEINLIEGLVTTSSCSGRVAVFVEGPRAAAGSGLRGLDDELEDEGEGEGEDVVDGAAAADGGGGGGGGTAKETGGPGGKGGGKWLFVSHEGIEIPRSISAPMDVSGSESGSNDASGGRGVTDTDQGWATRLCGLESSTVGDNETTSTSTSTMSLPSSAKPTPRLIKLQFSPLILHILCATLRHAQLLLKAAINAGFRESGVHSLKALDDPDAGVMVGIRTAGLTFESVIGVVVVDDDGVGERYRALVGEDVLGFMLGVVNERFGWNEGRRDRLRREIRLCFDVGKRGVWEDKEVRRVRLREEGLRRRMEMGGSDKDQNVNVNVNVDRDRGDGNQDGEVDIGSMFDDGSVEEI